jgi:hypothetical protein
LGVQGSNIFDILLALALPWLLEIMIFGNDISVSSKVRIAQHMCVMGQSLMI